MTTVGYPAEGMIEGGVTFRLVDGEWGKEFTEALCEGSSELRIICQFIKLGALQRLLEHNPKNVQVPA